MASPWHPEQDGHADDLMARELYREVIPTHALYGIRVRTIARRHDRDDVLFELLDGTGRFAVVHLTYARHRETNPIWPETRIYADFTSFEQGRMRPDADEWDE